MVWGDLNERIARVKSYLKSSPSYARHYYTQGQNEARDALLENFDNIFERQYIPPLPVKNIIAMINNILVHPEDKLSNLSAENIQILYHFSKTKQEPRSMLFERLMQFYKYPKEQAIKAITIEAQLLPLLQYRDTLRYDHQINEKLTPLIQHFRAMLETADEKQTKKILHELQKTHQLLEGKITPDQYQLDERNQPKIAKRPLWGKIFFKQIQSLQTHMKALKQALQAQPLDIRPISDTATDTTEALTVDSAYDIWSSFDNDDELDEEEEAIEVTPIAVPTPPHPEVAEVKPETPFTRLQAQISNLKQAGVKHPHMMSKAQKPAYKRVLEILGTLSEDESITNDDAFIELLKKIAHIVESIANANMSAGFWYHMESEPGESIPKDGQFILELRHYPKLQKFELAREMLRLCGLMEFRVDNLLEKAQVKASRQHPELSTNKPTHELVSLEALKRYLQEKNLNRRIEARVLPLIASFSKTLNHSSPKEQAQATEALQKTLLFLDQKSISHREYKTFSEKLKHSDALPLQVIGSLMLELYDETLQREPDRLHLGRVNTPRAQRYLEPLDKYILDHPNTSISLQLDLLARVFSQALESKSQKERIQATEAIDATVELLYGRLPIEDYQEMAERVEGAPSKLGQLMGVLMLVLSSIALVAGLATGVAPASIAGGVGLATGLSMFSKASERTGQSQRMLDLAETIETLHSNTQPHSDDNGFKPTG